MSGTSKSPATLTPASPPGPSVPVWDLPLRLFHWLLAAAVLTAYFSANVFDDVHEISGYAVLGLLVFRLIWGFAGSQHARFSSFVRSPRVVEIYLRQLAQGKSNRYLGHNPAGAVMIVTLLTLLAVSAVSGWMQLTYYFFGVTWVETVHTWSSNLVLILAIVHVLGVLLMSLVQKENLVRAMITGRKRDLSGES